MIFIGEAPGNTEIARGEPFVGASGQLLEASLAEYGITRSEVMLTNATLCHYPQSMKKLPKEAIAACQPRLLAEIEESGTTSVIPMGNSAIQAVFPKDVAKQGITRLRAGRPKSSALLPQGTTVVPTFHPAACLRSQEKFPRMLGDIGKAADPANLPEKWYEPEIVVVDYTDSNYGHLFSIMNDIINLNRNEVVHLDIETSREKDISYGNVHMNKLLCVGVGPTDPLNEHTVYVFTAKCFELPHFRKLFVTMMDECRVGAQNGKYDLAALRSYFGYAEFEGPKLSEDTMLQSYCLFEYSGVHGLEYMGMELLGTPDWKHDIEPYLRGEDGKQPVDYANIPEPILYQYNAFDVHATRLLHSFFARQIKEKGLEDAYRFVIKGSNALTLIEPRGLGFDVPYSQEFSDKLRGDKEALQRDLPLVSDPEAKSKGLRQEHPLNPDSPTQVTKYLADAGIHVETTEADELSELTKKFEVSEDVKRTLRTILDIRGITKLDGTFVGGLRQRVTSTGTVHPSFLIHGTTSGRLSSRNPNSQNIPRSKDVKRQFISRSPETHTMIGVDMSQAELRVLCYLSQDEGLREIFNDPSRDLFVELLKMMYPIEFKDSSFAEIKNHPKRVPLKGIVYGLAYGRTAAGVAADPQFGLDVRAAQDLMDKVSAVIPNVIDFLEGVADQALDPNQESIITPFGRQRRFHLITEMNKHSIRNEAKSFPAQSVASDIVLEAACRMTLTDDPSQRVFIVNMVHDAIYADHFKEDAPRIADLISNTMIQVAEEVTRGYVRFATDKKIGRSWADV